MNADRILNAPIFHQGMGSRRRFERLFSLSGTSDWSTGPELVFACVFSFTHGFKRVCENSAFRWRGSDLHSVQNRERSDRMPPFNSRVALSVRASTLVLRLNGGIRSLRSRFCTECFDPGRFEFSHSLRRHAVSDTVGRTNQRLREANT